MALRVVTPATGTIVSLDRAKLHLGEDAPERDEEILDAIKAATAMVESHAQRRYLTQTLEWVLPCWRPVLRLPVAPVQSVVEIRYASTSGVVQVLDPSTYVVSPSGDTMAIRPRGLALWPLLDDDAAEPVIVKFVAGATEAPPNVKSAVLLAVGDLYHNRETTGERAEQVRAAAAFDSLLRDQHWS